MKSSLWNRSVNLKVYQAGGRHLVGAGPMGELHGSVGVFSVTGMLQAQCLYDPLAPLWLHFDHGDLTVALQDRAGGHKVAAIHPLRSRNI